MTSLRNLSLVTLLVLGSFFAVAPSDAFACGGGNACDSPQVCCHFTAAMGDERCVASAAACTGATPTAGHVVADAGATSPSPTTHTSSAGSGHALTNPLNASSLTDLLALVLKTIVQLGSILLVLVLVWVGFLFVAAQGSEEKIRDARSALMWTIIGGLILLGAQAIATVIQATVQAI